MSQCVHWFDPNFTYNATPTSAPILPTPTVHQAQMVPIVPTFNRPLSDATWFPDSGATHHITPNYNQLQHPTPYHRNGKVQGGDGAGLSISYIGAATLFSSSHPLSLCHVLHVPQITRNLLSVQQFTRDNNVIVEFHPSFFLVTDLLSGMPLLRGRLKDGLYQLQSTNKLDQPRTMVGERASPSI